MDEAVKYLAINIYDKNKREHAGRVAIILTASANPRPVRGMTKMLRKKDITTLTVALGPGVNMVQINDITKVNPDNRAYILSSTAELSDRLLELTDYLCTLGLEPEVPQPLPPKTTPGIEPPRTSTTTPAPRLEPNPTQHPHNVATVNPLSGLSPVTTQSSSIPTKDVTFILEGSESVGEVNFNKSLTFLEEVISQLTEVQEEVIRITVIQYSVTVTVEISRWELRRQRYQLLRRLREIRWRGGQKTNTGAAVATIEEMSTVQPSARPAPPQLVFLVTENPPTDTVTRPPVTRTHTQMYPIGVGPKVREVDLLSFSSPQQPIMVEDYSRLSTLVHRVVNITRSTVRPRFPTLPPLILPTLPPSGKKKQTLALVSVHLQTVSACSNLEHVCAVPCKKPMDVMFLVKAGDEIEHMKTFVEAFINSADIGLFQLCIHLS